MYKEILKNTFASVFEKKDILFKALLIPTLLLMIFDYLLDTDLANLYISIPFFILSVLINITIAITTHRILLLKESQIPIWGLFKFTSREYKFLFATIGLLLFIFIPVFLLIVASSFVDNIQIDSSIGSIMIVIVAIAILISIVVIASRLSLVFPSISIEKNMTFKQAWSYTKNYKLLCFITIILFPALFSIIFGLAYGLVIGFLMKLISPQLDVLYTILNVFINVFMISALSNTYKYIVSQTPEIHEKKEVSTHITKLSINDYDTIELEENNEVTFESLKDALITQYEELDFVVTVVNEIDSWVVKQSEDGDAYVALRATKDEYQIQTFNTDEPILKNIKEQK